MDSLTNIPAWIFFLFVILVIIGMRAATPRTMSIYRLLVLPLIFMIWNLAWLFERVHEQFSLFPLWFLGIVGGSVLGWQSVVSWKIKADRKNKTVTLPGTWSVLVLILLVFAVRSFFVYSYETHPKQVEEYYIYDSLLSGIFTGIFIGRAYDLYTKYKKG
ncbi:MAG: hypothetical protein K1X28_10315 [Parachlamydiales bacterium]|nr:hypothetical protein [Parachlamydiales bacterium]